MQLSGHVLSSLNVEVWSPKYMSLQTLFCSYDGTTLLLVVTLTAMGLVLASVVPKQKET